MAVTRSPRFFVGVGTPRAGTTWLAEYLTRHPQVGFSPIKEVHFFNAAGTEGGWRGLREPVITELSVRGLARHALRRPVETTRLTRQYLRMRGLDPRAYRAYLEILTEGRRVAGEFTPIYAKLPIGRIRELDALLDRPRCLLVFRNPANRFASVNSFKRRRGEAVPELVEALERAIAKTREDPDRVSDSAYDGIIERYERVVGPERLLILFSEDVFSPTTVQATCDRLCAFLGVDCLPTEVGAKVNAAPPVAMNPALRRRLVRHLLPSYEALERRFGASLPPCWRADLELFAG